MFKIGDKVICVDIHTDLTYHKEYEILTLSMTGSAIGIINDYNAYQLCHTYGFILSNSKEARQLKLEKLKLCSSQGIESYV